MANKNYLVTSERVSIGHPDMVVDVTVGTLINEVYKKDGKTAHAALEGFVCGGETTEPTFIIGGEATTTLDFNSPKVIKVLKKAIERCGYTKANQKKFGKENVLCADDYKFLFRVNKQSPDIARGVAIDKGFNDQCVTAAYADNSNKTGLGLAHAIAGFICDKLFEHQWKSKVYGPDIKALVTVEYKNETTPIRITDITIAQSHTDKIDTESLRADIQDAVYGWLKKSEFKKYLNDEIRWVINGTGRFVRHGSLGDSGLTSRKISSNSGFSIYSHAFSGGLVKPHAANDKLMPILGRHIAKTIVDAGLAKTCEIQLGGAIGQTYLQSLRIIADDSMTQEMKDKVIEFINIEFPVISPATLNEYFKTFKLLNFNDVVATNFFGGDKRIQPWEDTTKLVKKLKKFLAE